MMNEELNEQEVQRLESELRSYGDPYASPEPDPRYFANFRARVMERVAEQPQPVSIGERIREFFFGSTLRLAATGGSLIAGTLIYFALQSSPEAPVAVIENKPVEQQIVTPQPQAPAPQIVQEAPKPEAAVVQNTKPVEQVERIEAPETPVTPRVSETAGSANIAEAAAAFESMDELSVSDDTEPVSYDKLSVDELEAILKTLETEPLTIQ